MQTQFIIYANLLVFYLKTPLELIKITLIIKITLAKNYYKKSWDLKSRKKILYSLIAFIKN